MIAQNLIKNTMRIALYALATTLMATKQIHAIVAPQLDPEFNADGEFPGEPGFLVFDPVVSLVTPLSFLVQDSVADSDGNRYIVGGAMIEGAPLPVSRSFALKASPTGIINFLTVLPQVGGSTISSEVSRGTTLNASGVLFLCGIALGAIPSEARITAARIEPDGTLSWSREYASVASKPLEGASNCDVNPNGELVIAAFAQDGELEADVELFVLTVDSLSGALLTSSQITALGPLVNGIGAGGTDFLIDEDQNYVFGATKALSGTFGGPVVFAAAKINPSGNTTIWTAVSEPINTSAPFNILQRIAIDSTSNIILAGIEEGIGGIDKFAAEKLNSLGVSLWATALQDPFGSTGSSDLLQGVTVNTLSNEIALVGDTNTFGPTRFATVLLNSSGSLLWTSILPSFVSGEDDQAKTISFATSLTAPLGCFFLAGDVDVTIGFGALLGTAQLTTTGATRDRQSNSLTAAVDVQSIGFNTDVATTDTNALVTPILLLISGGGFQLAMTQFSQTGSLNWLTIIEDSNIQSSTNYGPRTIVDPSNFSVTAFEQEGTTVNNFAATRVSETGSVSWSTVYPDLFGTGLASAATDVDLCLDDNYVLGGFFSRQQTPLLNSFAAAKITATGSTIVWKTGVIAPFGSTGSSDLATTISVDDTENIYLAGSTQETFDPVWAALCLSASGQMLNWTAVLPITGTIFDSAFNNGELLVGGGQGVFGDFVPLVARLDASNGALVDIVPVPLPDSMTNAVVASLTTDAEQNVYVLIGSDQTSTVLKFTNSFVPLWTIELPVTPSALNQIAGIDTDLEDNIVAGIPIFVAPITLKSTLAKIRQVLLPSNPRLVLPFVPLAAY